MDDDCYGCMNESWQFYETAMTWRHQAPGDDIRGAFGIAAWLHYTALCQPGGPVRRGAGAVERGGLENRCAFMGTQGSNPCLSANFQTVSGHSGTPMGIVVFCEV